MDADEFRRLETEFVAFLDRFSDCFSRKDTRAHLGVYVRGQLSDLPEKSVEPIALEAGVLLQTPQKFLSQLKWDKENRMPRSAGARTLAAEHAGPHPMGASLRPATSRRGTKLPAFKNSGLAAWARPRTASSPSTWVSLATIFTAFSTVSCICRRAGTPIATVAVRQVSPIPWSTGPSGRSAWNCTSERWTMDSSSVDNIR